MDLIPIKLKGVEESLKLSVYEDDKQEFTKKENYLSYLVMALGIIGILHFLVDQRLMMSSNNRNNIIDLVSNNWIGYYFIKKRARLGSLLEELLVGLLHCSGY
ncbi:MAG: hypothetical protein Ct9H300mP24_8130 [Candidatus Neomarinimicrobiota bacterium]|nr:MAG: hypothetical protein Ct9H300mP24_8130 [Candidatus Neomarinimicrobiota bacterium]